VASPVEGAATSRLAWVAPIRSGEERATAKARAQGGAAVVSLARRMARAARSSQRKSGGSR
jgi:hypothetical protein